MILIYLRCQRPRLFISAADSDASDRTRRTCCTRKTTSGTQGNLGSISAVSRVQSSMPSEKELFRKDERGLIFKTEADNRAYKRQKGTAKGYNQSEGEKASVLFTSTVSFTLRTKSVSCAGQICSYCRYILEILVLVYSATNLAAFGLSIQYKVNLSAL